MKILRSARSLTLLAIATASFFGCNIDNQTHLPTDPNAREKLETITTGVRQLEATTTLSSSDLRKAALAAKDTLASMDNIREEHIRDSLNTIVLLDNLSTATTFLIQESILENVLANHDSYKSRLLEHNRLAHQTLAHLSSSQIRIVVLPVQERSKVFDRRAQAILSNDTIQTSHAEIVRLIRQAQNLLQNVSDAVK